MTKKGYPIFPSTNVERLGRLHMAAKFYFEDEEFGKNPLEQEVFFTKLHFSYLLEKKKHPEKKDWENWEKIAGKIPKKYESMKKMFENLEETKS